MRRRSDLCLQRWIFKNRLQCILFYLPSYTNTYVNILTSWVQTCFAPRIACGRNCCDPDETCSTDGTTCTTIPDPPEPPTHESKSSYSKSAVKSARLPRLSSRAIVGIGLGVLAVVALLLAGIIWLCRFFGRSRYWVCRAESSCTWRI